MRACTDPHRITALIHPALPAAQDAQARSDEGAEALPGDADLIAAYDRYLQAAEDEYQERIAAAERAEWLASQCGGCEPGGTGEACDDHWDGVE